MPFLQESDDVESLPAHLPASPHQHGRSLSVGPDVVTLNELENDYEPVIFEHRRHAQMSAMGNECSNCHHYSEGGRITACKECHPAGAAETMQQPGLKGAYHRQCMGCHDTWSGASDCDMCHDKKAVPGPTQVAGGETTAQPHRILQPLEQPREESLAVDLRRRHRGHAAPHRPH